MADDDEAARKARAAALRRQIASLKPQPVEISGDDSEEDRREAADDRDAVDREAPSDETPREFVQRRMRELNKK